MNPLILRNNNESSRHVHLSVENNVIRLGLLTPRADRRSRDADGPCVIASPRAAANVGETQEASECLDTDASIYDRHSDF
jgi:hypothetical protein